MTAFMQPQNLIRLIIAQRASKNNIGRIEKNTKLLHFVGFDLVVLEIARCSGGNVRGRDTIPPFSAKRLSKNPLHYPSWGVCSMVHSISRPFYSRFHQVNRLNTNPALALSFRLIYMCEPHMKRNAHLERWALFWRRMRDSNSRSLAGSMVFKTISLNHSDNPPYQKDYTIFALESQEPWGKPELVLDKITTIC